MGLRNTVDARAREVAACSSGVFTNDVLAIEAVLVRVMTPLKRFRDVQLNAFKV